MFGERSGPNVARVQSIDCVVIEVRPGEVEAALRFYGELLGLPRLDPARSDGAPADPSDAAGGNRSRNGAPLTGEPPPQTPSPPPAHSQPPQTQPQATVAVFGAGRRQIHLRVNPQLQFNRERRRATVEVDSIARRAAALLEAGVEHTTHRGLAWSDVRILVRDPTGHLIELMQSRPL